MRKNKEMICFRLDPNLIRILRWTAANTGVSLVSIVEAALDRELTPSDTSRLSDFRERQAVID